jgi:indolepyruvate ferredoxin oxidoreductase beta subunit
MNAALPKAVKVPEAADAAGLRPITALVCALGGEGGGVLTEWLVQTALNAGHPAQSTSIPGVAQRTGATTYYIEIYPAPLAALGGRRPVLSLLPVPGALDVLVSSELLETVRQVGNGLVSAERTCVISSSSRTLTTAERMEPGDGRVAQAALLDTLRSHSREHHLLDMAALTHETGTVVSAVMFGALAGAGVLPFSRSDCEAVVRAGGRGVEASLRGFARAYEQVAAGRERGLFVSAVVAGVQPATAVSALSVAPPPRPTAPLLPADLAARFPADALPMLTLGHARLVDYQGERYARLYLDRVAKVADAVAEAVRAGRPQAVSESPSATAETARWLALWMAFDDIVRVADLKARASRRARVRAEVRVGEGELLRVHDHFKPGVPEIAALLPKLLADPLLRWDRRRQARGLPPFALPLKVGTHTVLGMAALRLLAGARWLRPHGTRYAAEQALIERWLAAVEAGAREDAALGLEVALCGRLIKGYGSTNERGKANLLHVVDHLAQPRAGSSAAERADAVRSARLAALVDEAGTALDRTLARHGAPPRPVPEVPIRFVRRPRPAS